MTDTLDSLTQAELVALAVEASRRDDTGHALAYLKEAAARADVSAQALFMLGSEYAQLGMLPDAKAAMHRAVEQDSELWIARFQLGMLHLTSGEPDAAKASWAPFDHMAAHHPDAHLAAFRQGMLHLMADEFDLAVRALRNGVELNSRNEPLNGDMRRVIDAIQHLPGRDAALIDLMPGTGTATPPPTQPVGGGAPPPEAPPDVESELSHLFIKAYTDRGKPH